MSSAILGKIALEVNAELTRHIYTSIDRGETVRCGCAYCRNFIAQLPKLFPREVASFIEQCGIDINKDADIGQTGETHPGYYRYAGEYYFICQTPPIVDADILQNGFEFTITLPSPAVPDEFRNVSGARSFNFSYEIPWMLSERP